MFLIIRTGVYIRGVLGLHETQTGAVHRALELAKEEEDDYHSLHVIPMKVGIQPEPEPEPEVVEVTEVNANPFKAPVIKSRDLITWPYDCPEPLFTCNKNGIGWGRM